MLALWSAIGCQERLRGSGTGTFMTLDFCSKSMGAVGGKPIKKIKTGVSPGYQLLAKEPEDSWYEINIFLRH